MIDMWQLGYYAAYVLYSRVINSSTNTNYWIGMAHVKACMCFKYCMKYDECI